MKLAKIILASLIFNLLLISNTTAKELFPLDGTWQFALGPAVKAANITDYPPTSSIDKKFVDVTIPHTWNDRAVERLNNGEGFHWGMGWYKKEFKTQKSWKNRRIFIRFDAVGTKCKVKLNGKDLGEHKGPYSAFCYEITNFISEDNNLLEVEVSNMADKDMVPAQAVLQTSFGGIYRPVNILVGEEVCISPLDYATSGVYLTPLNVSKKSADLNIRVMTSTLKGAKGVQFTATLKNAEGKEVKTIYKVADLAIGESYVDLDAKIKKPHLWDGVRDPYLYSVEVKLNSKNGKELDFVSQPVGFRYFEFLAGKGLILNGKYYDVYGTSRWQDWQDQGFAITTKEDSTDIALMVELGATGARFGHYQQDETIANLTDANGLVSIAELALIPPLSKSEAFHQNCRQQLTELIKQLYNHPSIMVWNLLNEIYPSEERVRDLHNLAHELDSTRVTSVVYNKPVKSEEKGWYNVADLVCSNKYPWWYQNAGDDLGNAGVFADRLKEVQSLRKDVVFGITEYGAGGCITQHEQNPKAPEDTKYGRFFPEEYQSLVHEKQWALLGGNRDYWCKLVWNLADFTWSTASRGDVIGRNHKGLVTHDRKVKKDAFFFYKSNWNKKDATLYITSRRHVKRSEALTPVKIYSNCKKVELFVNGISQGSLKNGNNSTFVWNDIELKKGVNKIEVSGKFKGKKIKDSCEWVLE